MLEAHDIQTAAKTKSKEGQTSHSSTSKNNGRAKMRSAQHVLAKHLAEGVEILDVFRCAGDDTGGGRHVAIGQPPATLKSAALPLDTNKFSCVKSAGQKKNASSEFLLCFWIFVGRAFCGETCISEKTYFIYSTI